MSTMLWIGLGSGTLLALVLVIQTLRLKAAKKDLVAAKAAIEDAHAAQDSAERRLETERKNAASWKRRSREIQDRLSERLGELDKQRDAVDKERDEVRNAAGDKDATLDVLRRALADDDAREPAVPEREPVDRDRRLDDPV